jgi:hypothetical protein
MRVFKAESNVLLYVRHVCIEFGEKYVIWDCEIQERRFKKGGKLERSLGGKAAEKIFLD